LDKASDECYLISGSVDILALMNLFNIYYGVVGKSNNGPNGY